MTVPIALIVLGLIFIPLVQRADPPPEATSSIEVKRVTIDGVCTLIFVSVNEYGEVSRWIELCPLGPPP